MENQVAGSQGQATPAGEANAGVALLQSIFAPPPAEAAGEAAAAPQPVDPVIDRLGNQAAKFLTPPTPAPQGSQAPAPQADPQRALLDQQALVNRQLQAQVAQQQQQMQALQTESMARMQEAMQRMQEIATRPQLTPAQREAELVAAFDEFNRTTPAEFVSKAVAPQFEAMQQQIAELQEQLKKNQAPLQQFQQTQKFQENMSRVTAALPEVAHPAFQQLMFSPENVDKVVSTYFGKADVAPDQIFQDPNFYNLLAAEARVAATQKFQPAANEAAATQQRMMQQAQAPVVPGSRPSAQPAQPKVSPDAAFRQAMMSNSKSFDQAVATSGMK